MQKNQFLKVKNSLLKLEKDFMELKYRKLKDRRKIEDSLIDYIPESIRKSVGGFKDKTVSFF